MSGQLTDDGGEYDVLQDASPLSARAGSASPGIQGIGTFEAEGLGPRSPSNPPTAKPKGSEPFAPATSRPFRRPARGMPSLFSPNSPAEGGGRPSSRQSFRPPSISFRSASDDNGLTTPVTADLVDVPGRYAVWTLFSDLPALTPSIKEPERLKELVERTLQPALATARNYLESYMARHEQDTKKLSSAQDQLRAVQEDVEFLQGQTVALENERDGLQQESDLKVASLEHRAQEAEHRAQEAELSCSKLVEDLDRATEQQEATADELKAAKNIEASLSKQLKHWQQDFSKAQHDKQHVERREVDLEKKFDLLSKQHQDMASDFARQAAELEAKAADMADQLREKTEVLEDTKEDYDKLSSDYEMVDSKYQDVTEQFEDMVAARDKSLAETQIAKVHAKELQKELDALRAQHDAPEDREADDGSKQSQHGAEADSKIKALEEQIQTLQESHLKEVASLKRKLVYQKESWEQKLKYHKRMRQEERARAGPHIKYKTIAQEWEEDKANAMKILGISDLSEKKKELEKQILDLETKAQAENSDAKLKLVQESLSKCQDELADTKLRHDELYEDFVATSNTAKEAQASVEDLQKQLAQVTTRAQADSSLDHKLAKDLANALHERAKNTEDKEAATDQLKALEHKIREDAKKNAMTKKLQDEYKAQLAEQQQRLTEEREGVEDERRMNQDEREALENESRILGERQELLLKYQKELEEAKQALEKKEISVNHLRDTVEAESYQIAEKIEEQRKEAERIAAEEKNRHEAVRAEQDASDARIRALKEEQKELEDRKAERQSELRKLQKELADQQEAFHKQRQASELALKNVREAFDSKLKAKMADLDAKLKQRQDDFDAELKMKRDDQSAELGELLKLVKQREQELNDREQRLAEREEELRQRAVRIDQRLEAIKELRGSIRLAAARAEAAEARHPDSQLCFCTLFRCAPSVSALPVQSPGSRKGKNRDGARSYKTKTKRKARNEGNADDDDEEEEDDDDDDTSGQIRGHGHGSLRMHFPNCQLLTALLWFVCFLAMPFLWPVRPLLLLLHLCGWTPLYFFRLCLWAIRVRWAKAWGGHGRDDRAATLEKPAALDVPAGEVVSSLLWLYVMFLAMFSIALWRERSIWLSGNNELRAPYARELTIRNPHAGWGLGLADLRLLYQPLWDLLFDGDYTTAIHRIFMGTG